MGCVRQEPGGPRAFSGIKFEALCQAGSNKPLWREVASQGGGPGENRELCPARA